MNSNFKKILPSFFCILTLILANDMHYDRVIDIDLSNNKEIYASAGKDGKIFIFDAQNHSILHSFNYKNEKNILQISISYNNKFLAAGFNDGTIDIINLSNQSKETLFINNSSKIQLLKFVGNGHLLYSDKNGNNYLWNIYTKNNSIQLVNDFITTSSIIIDTKINSNRNNILSFLESNQFARWDIGQIKIIKYSNENNNFSSDFRIKGGNETSKIVFDTTLSFIDTNETKLIDPPSKSKWRNIPYDFYDYDISPDGSKIAIITNENLAIIWNSNFTEKEIHIACHDFRINDIEFSNNGRYFATSSIDKTLKIWDVYTGKLVNSIFLYKDWATKLIFNDQTLIYGTFNGEINFLDID